MLIVHIGLGKTATSTLQQSTFPWLVQNGFIDRFTDPRVEELVRRFDEEPDFKLDIPLSETYRDSSCLVSNESLVGWNPAFWEQSFERNKKLFGAEAVILITVRDPVSYLTSLYQQSVQEGNVIEANKFFLNSEDYYRASRMTRPALREIIDVDKFRLAALVEMYSAFFAKVIVVPYSKIGEMKFLAEFCPVDEPAIKTLTGKYRSFRSNRSLSDLAMRLTLRRERMLRKIGLKSLGSCDEYYIDLPEPGNMKPPGKFQRFDELGFLQKLWQFLPRLLGKFRTLWQWNALMAGCLDRVIRHKRYRLPNTVWLGKHLEENARYVLQVEESTEGYKVYRRGEQRA
jgi:hypothetical protein